MVSWRLLHVCSDMAVCIYNWIIPTSLCATFYHPSLDEHLDYFHCFTVMCSAAINSYLQVLFEHLLFSALLVIVALAWILLSRVGLFGGLRIQCLAFWDDHSVFYSICIAFVLLSTVYKAFSMSSPTCSPSLDYCHPSMYEVVPLWFWLASL